ncbi:MAG: hypothetical protein IAE91_03030 [Ignavibacteriaceae bacterium]|nr:hypothetical protein [Ignavibacteriaceae bacterium]
MKRTQIYLDDDIYEMLKIESKKKKKRISFLIREALREKYVKSDSSDMLISEITGLWKNRTNKEKPE